ncbi:MAG TPA: BrnA antitoxin family protein, partial [Thermoanaerobaculia bacterium]|nr:BrnA antitoxin family protein [Thermoanaerobaculia bacterium]
MKRKPIPKFKNEAEEKLFWSRADSADYADWSKAEVMTLPELHPTLKTISLRLPVSLIAELKLLANKRDVPYQSLL